MIKITLMLRSITLLQSASICWTFIGSNTQNPALVRSCRNNISTSTVEPLVLDQSRANVSTPTKTYCQQLQPLPNVGPTIACYLGTF